MKPLKFVLIGCGRIGIMHAHNITNLVANAEIFAVVDTYVQPQVKTKLKALGIKHIGDDIDQIINHPEVDAFVIASPTYTHIDLIQKIINTNNKPIFCEKPLSIKWRHVIDLKKQIANKKAILQLGYNRRFDINFKKVREAVQAGAVGKQYLITITSFDSKPPQPKFVKEAGMLWTDMNIHDFDMIRHVTGAEIETVFVAGANLVSEKLQGIDVDVSTINLQLSNGALGMIQTTRHAAYGYDQRIEVLGAKGQVQIKNQRPSTFCIDTARGRQLDNPNPTFIERYKTAFLNEIESFIDVVQNHHQPIVGIDDDLQALKVASAAEISFKENRIVNLKEIN